MTSSISRILAYTTFLMRVSVQPQTKLRICILTVLIQECPNESESPFRRMMPDKYGLMASPYSSRVIAVHPIVTPERQTRLCCNPERHESCIASSNQQVIGTVCCA